MLGFYIIGVSHRLWYVHISLHNKLMCIWVIHNISEWLLINSNALRTASRISLPIICVFYWEGSMYCDNLTWEKTISSIVIEIVRLCSMSCTWYYVIWYFIKYSRDHSEHVSKQFSMLEYVVHLRLHEWTSFSSYSLNNEDVYIILLNLFTSSVVDNSFSFKMVFLKILLSVSAPFTFSVKGTDVCLLYSVEFATSMNILCSGFPPKIVYMFSNF